MPKEIETKFKVDSLRAFEKRLIEMGGRCEGARKERDIYYKAPPGIFSPEVIRLRFVGKKGIFTVKEKTGGRAGRYKIKNETETFIENPGMFEKMLKGLGFTERFRKEKIRKTYRWKDGLICLDRLPYIGDYIEIEGPKRRIREIARTLKLDMSLATPETYMQIFNRYRARLKRPNLKLVF